MIAICEGLTDISGQPAAKFNSAERCGFVLDGIHRHAQRAPDGALCSMVMYARLAVDQR